MKKIAFLLIAWLSISFAHAQDYQFLTFELNDGMFISLPSDSLTMTFENDTLVTASQSFPISNLKRMFFSEDNETSIIETIEKVQVDTNDIIEAYDLQGHKVAKEQIKNGVFIIKTNESSYKIIAK